MYHSPLRRGGVLLVLCLIACLCLTTVAQAAVPSFYTERVEKTLSPTPDRALTKYPTVTVRTDRGTVIRGRLIGDTTYVALRDVFDAYGIGRISYDANTRTATVQSAALTLTVTDGAYVIYANGRALFSETPCVILSDGRLYAPIRPLAKAYGVAVRWNGTDRSVTLTGAAAPLESAESFYRADELYWLSRIISAESRGEELLGQIGVGCVVLNRQSSPDFPATIYGVIFDRKYGVQFTPVLNGTVYQSPYTTSVLAAKICLEGYSVSDEAQFFLEPTKSSSSWVPRNRHYLFSIGRHDFYA